MIKAMIIDDEFIVVEGLKKLIDWKKYDIEIISTATDGISGLNLIMEHKPDLVFIDIRMPGTNGLSVIEQAKLIMPQVLFVIISGFSDFNYAKKAISLGVMDYLEKPVTIENIEAVLTKIKPFIKNTKKIQTDQENITLLETFLFKLLGGENYFDSDEFDLIESIKAEFVSKFNSNQNIYMCLGQLCDWDDDYNDDLSIIELTFKVNIISKKNKFIFVKRNTRFLILYEGYSNLFNEIIYDCHKWCERANIIFSAGISASFYEVNQLKDAWDQASSTLKSLLFSENAQIWAYYDKKTQSLLGTIGDEFQNKLIGYMKNNDKTNAILTVNDFFESLKEKALLEDECYHIALEILYLMIKFSKSTGKTFYNSDGTSFIPHVEVKNCTNINMIQALIEEKLEEILDWVLKTNESNYHKSIITVKNYIDANFEKDLTLMELSNIAKLNSAYFSVLFKEEIGISYIKYLTNVRMEKAKEFLNLGFKVTKVSSMVGYPNSRYFCEIFKKINKITPKQFQGARINS